MMRGVNPRQIERAMRQAGIKTKDITDVDEVIIRTKTEEYVITNASVTMMDVKGQKNISGDGRYGDQAKRSVSVICTC